MIKKVFCLLFSIVMCLSFAACGGTNESNAEVAETTAVETAPVEATEASAEFEPAVYEEVSLTEDEAMILEAMGSDVNVVAEDAYVETVAELIYHTSEYVGTVYQVEGIFSIDGEDMSVYRILENGDEIQNLGLPVRYLEKDIVNNAWVRLTGVVASAEVNGENVTVLDIVAIEALPEYGQTHIQWDGSAVHQH